MKKEVIRRLVRLANGVAVAGRVIRVLPVDETGEMWQAAVLVALGARIRHALGVYEPLEELDGRT